jgi:hypothetical protein
MVCRLIWVVLYIPKWILVRLLCGRDTPVRKLLVLIRLSHNCVTEGDCPMLLAIIFFKRMLLQFKPQPSRIPVAVPRPAAAYPQEKRFPYY